MAIVIDAVLVAAKLRVSSAFRSDALGEKLSAPHAGRINRQSQDYVSQAEYQVVKQIVGKEFEPNPAFIIGNDLDFILFKSKCLEGPGYTPRFVLLL